MTLTISFCQADSRRGAQCTVDVNRPCRLRAKNARSAQKKRCTKKAVHGPCQSFDTVLGAAFDTVVGMVTGIGHGADAP